jgi:hypothetical protein
MISPSLLVRPPMECGFCGVVATQICSKCKTVAYCGVEHQRLHWSTHKHSCKKQSKQTKVSKDEEPWPSASSDGKEEKSDPVRKSCRCMFCGEELILSSEDEAVQHMEVCPALQEQLNDSRQFTLPESIRPTTGP